MWKEATPKPREEEVLPPFLLDWEDADLEPGQSMPNLEDLMRSADHMADQQSPGPTAAQSQPQYDEAQQWIASMFEEIEDHVTIEELANQDRENRRPVTVDRRPATGDPRGRTNRI